MHKFCQGHLFLINCAKFCDLEKQLIAYKKGFLANEDQKIASIAQTKIEKNLYLDNYFLDAKKGVKKEDVKILLDTIINPSIEISGWKFYTIYNVEQLNNFCYNALLKFIENPPSKTIGFLITRHPNKIPKTIRSRAQEIVLKYVPVNLEKYFDKDKDINQALLEKVFSSIEEIDEFYNSKNFKLVIDLYFDIKKLKINEKNIFNHLNNFKLLDQNDIYILLKFLYQSNNYWKNEAIYKIIEGNNFNVNRTLLFDQIINLG